jgi:hypothetical protein
VPNVTMVEVCSKHTRPLDRLTNIDVDVLEQIHHCSDDRVWFTTSEITPTHLHHPKRRHLHQTSPAALLCQLPRPLPPPGEQMALPLFASCW